MHDASKCLEAGNKLEIYSAAFMWTCNGYSHQHREIQEDGRLKNKNTSGGTFYLDVGSSCFNADLTNKRLELQYKLEGNRYCACAQKWNNLDYRKSCDLNRSG